VQAQVLACCRKSVNISYFFNIRTIVFLFSRLSRAGYSRVTASLAMSRAQRIAFALASLVILVAIYQVSLQLPTLRSDTPSADWTANPIPTSWPAHPVPTHSSYTPNKPHPASNPPPSASPSNASPSKAIQTGSPSKALQSDSHFISWLSARIPTDRIPFITIGDGKYVHALRNFRHRLDQWGYGDDFVVICLDQCCADGRGYHAYPYFIGESVAFIKVRDTPTVVDVAF